VSSTTHSAQLPIYTDVFANISHYHNARTRNGESRVT